MLIMGQLLVPLQKLKHLLHNIFDAVFDLVKHPVIVSARIQDSGILQVDQMAGRLGLGEVKYLLEVRNTHFAIQHNQAENTQPRFICASLEYLRSKRQIEGF